MGPERPASEDDVNALAVITDCGPSWAERDHADLGALLQGVLLFLNAYQLLLAGNQLVLFAVQPEEVQVIWPPPEAGADAFMGTSDAHSLRAAVAAAIARLAASQREEHKDCEERPLHPAPLLSMAMGTAVCRLQRACRSQPKVQPRMLVISAAEDSIAQHLGSMNCVFAAQKLGILIDGVCLARQGSMVLQHAATLTGGLYLQPDAATQRGLAQYLITCCLPNRYERQYLRQPHQGRVETRALCFLTKRPLEVGHACSVCLAVFDHDKLRACPVCDTRFALMIAPGQFPKKKKKMASSGAAAADGCGGAGPAA